MTRASDGPGEGPGGKWPEELTYPTPGVTQRRDFRPPPGYATVLVHTRLGSGAALYQAACQELFSFRMHRAAGLRVETSARCPAPGVRVTVAPGVGRLRFRAPCQVVWTTERADRCGWAYGTLPGHPVSGEEAFMVVRDGDDAVWLTVTAFSRPACWPVRLAGPVARLGQRAYAWWCGRTLRRLARAAVTSPGSQDSSPS